MAAPSEARLRKFVREHAAFLMAEHLIGEHGWDPGRAADHVGRSRERVEAFVNRPRPEARVRVEEPGPRPPGLPPVQATG